MFCQDEKQGKMLLHTEHSLLSLLEGEPGVVQKHTSFVDTALQVLLKLIFSYFTRRQYRRHFFTYRIVTEHVFFHPSHRFTTVR